MPPEWCQQEPCESPPLPAELPGSDAGLRWWLGLSGVVGVIASIVAFVYTGMLVLLMFMAVWAIIIGALQLYAAIQVRNFIANVWWLVRSGLI